MKKLLLCAALAAAATTLHGATIFYSAVISCSTCVTVTLSWANEPVPIFTAVAEDSSGTPLFPLNVATPSFTGSIFPNPQTVSQLPSSTINLVSNGQAGLTSLSIQPQGNVFAVLALLDANGRKVDSTLFTATVPSGVPEPAAWSLTCTGMALLLLRMRKRRRNT